MSASPTLQLLPPRRLSITRRLRQRAKKKQQVTSLLPSHSGRLLAFQMLSLFACRRSPTSYRLQPPADNSGRLPDGSKEEQDRVAEHKFLGVYLHERRRACRERQTHAPSCCLTMKNTRKRAGETQSEISQQTHSLARTNTNTHALGHGAGRGRGGGGDWRRLSAAGRAAYGSSAR